jgi:16S rRNA (cytidine1402-2'-O)-methyltransferase
MAGTLFVVATPIGNLEDITARALRVLREVALIAAEDTRRTAHLLARYGIATKMSSLHEHNESGKASKLVERLKAGESIALVSDAGTPTVSDPGNYLVAEAVQAGIRIEPIPGPNAAVAALSASGLAGDTFLFMGFPPSKAKDRRAWFDRLSHSGPTTAVFHEAPHKIRWTLEELQRAVGDTQIVLAREMTKVHEELVRGPISGVLSALSSPLGEFTIVVVIGQPTEQAPPGAVRPADLLIEFGYMTNTVGLTRRQGISRLSRKYKISAREAYSMLEAAKKSGC